MNTPAGNFFGGPIVRRPIDDASFFLILQSVNCFTYSPTQAEHLKVILSGNTRKPEAVTLILGNVAESA